ncbi:MAG: hypothetical protein OEU80_02170 [Deltaproteobacteria bacterium]|nr:hypothetical protein [Deltaproteobacteria bacterium]
MAVLPGVLGCRPLRRTVQVRLGTNTLWLQGTRRKRLRCAWHAHLRGLATAIHEISELKVLSLLAGISILRSGVRDRGSAVLSSHRASRHVAAPSLGHYASLSFVVIGRRQKAAAEVGSQRSEERLCPK